MWYESIFTNLGELFNADRAFKHVEMIYSEDRWNSFDHYNKSASYCAEQMKKIGLVDVEMLPVAADGRTSYGEWIIPRASDVSQAVLKIVQPFTSEPIVADYLKEPFNLMMNSAPTPEGGIEAEVIIVDDPTKVTPEDVRGKLIFTGCYFSEVLPIAIKGNAVGIISDNSIIASTIISRGYMDKETMKDSIFWVNSFLIPLNETNLFGFQLSYRSGANLREFISNVSAKGETVRMHALVDSHFYDGFLYVVSGMIPGSDPQGEEINIYSHLHEGGANDNASGCGVSLELATAIIEGISKGKLPRPRRNIRFIMAYEATGGMGYISKHRERISNTTGWINIDMVGSNTDDKAIFDVYHNPWSTWSYHDTLAPALIREYQYYTRDKFGFGEKDFEFLDNLVADPMYNVPTISTIMCPAESYHSSIDTMERVDPHVLKRTGLITGALIYFITSADSKAIRWLLDEISVHAYTVLSQVGRKRWYSAYPLANAFRRGCLSLQRLADKDDKDILNDILQTADKLPSLSAPDLRGTIDKQLLQQAEKLIPIRQLEGCLTYLKLPIEISDSARWKVYWRYRWNCPVLLSDGKRNLFEIGYLAAAELAIENLSDYLAELIKYFQFLEKHEYIKFM